MISSICALAGCAAIANAATPSVTAPDRQNRGRVNLLTMMPPSLARLLYSRSVCISACQRNATTQWHREWHTRIIAVNVHRHRDGLAAATLRRLGCPC